MSPEKLAPWQGLLKSVALCYNICCCKNMQVAFLWYMQRLELMLWLRTERWRKKGRHLRHAIYWGFKVNWQPLTNSGATSKARQWFFFNVSWSGCTQLVPICPQSFLQPSQWEVCGMNSLAHMGKTELTTAMGQALCRFASCAHHWSGALMVLKHQKAVNQWSCIKDRCQVLIFCNTNAERWCTLPPIDTEECGSASERSLKVTCASNSLRSSCWAWQQSPLERT